MPHGVNAAMKGMKESSPDQPGDHVRTEPGAQELPTAHDPLVPRRQARAHAPGCNNRHLSPPAAFSFTFYALGTTNVQVSPVGRMTCTLLHGSHTTKSPEAAPNPTLRTYPGRAAASRAA
jgi:hypothetical protein